MSKKIQQYFANNPEEKEVFSTSDGFLFKMEMYATAHAATITDKAVTKNVREVNAVVLTNPIAEVPVSTVAKNGAKIRTKNEGMNAPKVTDSPLETAGKVDAIKDAVTDQLNDVVAIAPADKVKPATKVK